jgi:hypothetical protein
MGSVMTGRQPKPVNQLSAVEFEAMFPDEDACRTYLVARRWPYGVRCPRCGAENPHKLQTSPWTWQCYKCAPQTSYRFSHLAGTIFEDTKRPLRDWYKVVHLMLESRFVHLMLPSEKGISPLQVMRFMGFGSYKTAWKMCRKIRIALTEDIDKLGGIVEFDGTTVGGKIKSRRQVRPVKRALQTAAIGGGVRNLKRDATDADSR